MDKRKRIAILVGQAEEEYQANFISGFLTKAFARNYDVCVFAMYQRFQETPAREIGESSIFSLIEYDQFDVIVLMSDTIQTPGLTQRLEETIRKRFSGTVLVIDQESEYFPSIELDYYEPVKKLIAHLIEHHGYTEIGYVTGWKEHKHSKVRLRAFRDCMAEHNLPVNEDWIYYGDFWYNGGEQLVEKLIKAGKKLPRAIACANDYMAIGAGKMLEKYGLRVPEDVALEGYDMVEDGMNSPKPLTSAPLSTYRHGEYAMDCIEALIAGKEIPEFVDDVELFIGSSCGCHNESVEPKVTLREHWITDMSERAFYAPNNHMSEDLLCQTSFYDLMNTLNKYIYQIGDFHSFHICLNEDWSDFEKKELQGRQNEIYSNRMLHVVNCGPGSQETGRIHFDSYFATSLLLPELHESYGLPKVYFFTPLYFEERSFGYAVVSYENKAQSYDALYRMWLRNFMQELECFRRIEAIQRSNQRLEASMIRDSLTGLYNYNGFLKQRDNLLRRILREGLTVGVLTMDIKELLKINEKQGRSEGDRVIIELSNSIQDAFPEDLNMCFGNGEVVTILLTEGDAEAELLQGFEQVKERMALINVRLFRGIETGVPKSVEELERLVNSAVSRKNGSKVSERKQVQGEKFTEEEQKEAKIVEELLDRNRFHYHFQPIVYAKTGEIYGYEALMRPDVDPYLPPPVVLKYAEYFDRMYDVERATFFNILDIVSHRRDIFDGNRKVFINSIPGNLLHGEDAERLEIIARDLKQTVMVEITEWLELSDEELGNLKRYYNRIGFNTAIDDYGAGYSNVTNLLRYMPNCVKIDRMLLSDIQNSPQKQHFVKDIITFSHDNNIKVIAEGVETAEELQTVILLGVDLIQGYYIARPSAEIIPAIPNQVINDILEFNRQAGNNKGRRVYVSGKESRISLAKLIAEKYSIIEITNKDVVYNDVTIYGVPDMETDIYVRIKNGYHGRIVLDNVTFKGKKYGASIDIGNDCDVVIVLEGDNFCYDGGIRVPENSKLVIEGDGNLNITTEGANYFGIGNDANHGNGNLIFDQDGTIDIKGSGMRGVGIGSGLGGTIFVQRGKYNIRLLGKDGVGIGSFIGDVTPIITNCEMNVRVATTRAVGVGSIRGNVHLRMLHTTWVGEFNADETVGAGTIEGKIGEIKLAHINYIANIRAYKYCGIGAFDGEVSISLHDGAVLIEGDGTEGLCWGNLQGTAQIHIRAGKMDARARSRLVSNAGAREEDIFIEHGEYDYIVNGEPRVIQV